MKEKIKICSYVAVIALCFLLLFFFPAAGWGGLFKQAITGLLFVGIGIYICVHSFRQQNKKRKYMAMAVLVVLSLFGGWQIVEAGLDIPSSTVTEIYASYHVYKSTSLKGIPAYRLQGTTDSGITDTYKIDAGLYASLSETYDQSIRIEYWPHSKVIKEIMVLE